jgi:Protein of unknown function (DUF2637)
MSVHTSMTEDQPGTSAQPGHAQASASDVAAGQPEKAPRAWRILGLAAVCLGLAALAAATFVLSYSGIRAVALEAGITPRLARGYPLLVDAMLVIVLAAVLALRGAGLPSKVLAWLTLLVVLAAAAGADGLHAADRTLPHRPAAITAAVLPWALVLVAFALLLLMLRHARLRRAASARVSLAPHGPARAHWQPGQYDPAQYDPAQYDPAQYDPAQSGYRSRSAPMRTLDLPVRVAPTEPPVGQAFSAGDAEDPDLEAEHEAADADAADVDPDTDDDTGMPVFHRMWSAPTPPEP